MKLTPEQIAAFEARAEAGEKPTKELWSGNHLKLLGMPFRVEIHTGFGLPENEYYVSGNKFGSFIAAQLAAEHLLREATRGLHQKAYRAIEEVRSFAWGEKQMCSISQVGPYENILELLPPKEQTDEAN